MLFFLFSTAMSYCLTMAVLAQYPDPGRGNRGYGLGRILPVPVLFSSFIPLTSIFRFLPKHFDPWLFIYRPDNLLSKGLFVCVEILKSHILDFEVSILTLSSLSSPTFFFPVSSSTYFEAFHFFFFPKSLQFQASELDEITAALM